MLIGRNARYISIYIIVSMKQNEKQLNNKLYTIKILTIIFTRYSSFINSQTAPAKKIYCFSLKQFSFTQNLNYYAIQLPLLSCDVSFNQNNSIIFIYKVKKKRKRNNILKIC